MTMLGQNIRAAVIGTSESEADAGSMLSTYQLKRRVDGLDGRMDLAEQHITDLGNHVASVVGEANKAIAAAVDVNIQQQSALEKLGAFTAVDYDKFKSDVRAAFDYVEKAQVDQNTVINRDLTYARDNVNAIISTNKDQQTAINSALSQINSAIAVNNTQQTQLADMIAVNKAQQSNLDNVNTQLNAIYKGLYNEIVMLNNRVIDTLNANMSRMTKI
jgi:hypothetical protein